MDRHTALARVAAWNERYPVGTPVQYWRYDHEPTARKPGVRSHTTARAAIACGTTPVVWVVGCTGAVPLDMIDPLES